MKREQHFENTFSDIKKVHSMINFYDNQRLLFDILPLHYVPMVECSGIDGCGGGRFG